MGLTTKIVETWTCDLCGAECRKNSNEIDYPIDAGRVDVGPRRIQAKVTAYIPYGTDKGHLCNRCLIQHLREYLLHIEKKQLKQLKG